MFLDLSSPWSSFRDLDRVFDDLARLAGSPRRATGGQAPVNVWADDEALAITAELPGVKPEQVELSIHDDTVTISANRSTEEARDGWLRRERGDWTLHRTVQLPYRVDEASAEARLKDGVLTVALKRQAADKPRSIAVKAG